MTLKLFTLCENTATFGFKAEWGLSTLVQRDGFTFLFDTGMSDVTVQNAQKFQDAFSDINSLVLSHGHVDHTGGLPQVLDAVGTTRIVAHPAVFERKFSERRNPPNQDISIPLNQAQLEAMGHTLVLSKEPVELAPGIITSGEVPQYWADEQVAGGLMVERNGVQMDDPMDDDLSIAIDTREGLVILLGCAHRGPVSTVRHFMELTGNKKVYLLTGGMHLGRATDQRIAATIDFCAQAGIKKIAPCHCTGFNAMAAFKRAFGNQFLLNQSGSVLRFDV